MRKLKGQTEGYDDLTKDEPPFSDESFITRFWKVFKYLLLKPFVRGCQNCKHYRLIDGKFQRLNKK